MSFIKEKDTISVLNLWHHLLEELFFVLDAAAVDLVEGFLACGTESAGKFSLANATLAVEHEERKNRRVLVSIKIKVQLALNVILSDDMREGFVHELVVVRC